MLQIHFVADIIFIYIHAFICIQRDGKAENGGREGNQDHLDEAKQLFFLWNKAPPQMRELLVDVVEKRSCEAPCVALLH